MARGGGVERELGASAVEYALMIAAIAVVIVVAVSTVGGALQTVFASTGDAFDGSTVDSSTPAVTEPTGPGDGTGGTPPTIRPGGPQPWTPPGGGGPGGPRANP